MPTEVDKQLSGSIFVFHQQEAEVILLLFLSLRQRASQHAPVPIGNILHGREWFCPAIISSHVSLRHLTLEQTNMLHYLQTCATAHAVVNAVYWRDGNRCKMALEQYMAYTKTGRGMKRQEGKDSGPPSGGFLALRLTQLQLVQ